MKKINQLIIHTIPLALGVVLVYFLWNLNLILLIAFGLFSFLLIFFGEDSKTEFWIFIYGAAAGTIIELIGSQFAGYESFANPDFFSIPVWLIVAWGYGFVLMKRISLIIISGSPWLKKIS